ncbi:hypothetical protein FQR65_LT02650 [Abscondita terminalis]|nr:hypothetical protein FQR65_LT02650 [Abscondita terminalis]
MTTIELICEFCRAIGNNTTMMQITEDTPPDMLAGAMDLTIHLPNGRTVKMSVERSTPMMDLLVQITTANQLQHSGHILQALEMAPSSGKTDKILPYKPNTPIGALDTQHVKVVPKNRPIPAPRHASTGHQPFESTFRLQVHLPRNQLYVIRVSQHVLLEDIMKKVCDEKNLDTRKYEFRHPGNLNEVLDPKLTLSDYQITEVYIVSKGTVGLTQAFSSNDIMVLKKEEERKQMQARTGGGVFSLIFKRKQGTGSGSLSSENRSISPSHSDESRSVTPPAIQQQIVIQPAIPEKPKAPQRKRRPAPKPPQQPNVENQSRQVSTTSETNNSDLQTKNENGLTICHSRNSSDSSGYHEPSVLSENINLSLPRRPKSSGIETVREETAVDNKPSGNLSKMAVFSKSTTSITSRKKKAAPPPPPEKIPEKASPVVASPIVEVQGECTPSVFEERSYQNVEELRVTSDVNTIVEELGKPDVDNETKKPPIPARRKKEFKLPIPMPRKESVELVCPISQVDYTSTTVKEDNNPDDEVDKVDSKQCTLLVNPTIVNPDDDNFRKSIELVHRNSQVHRNSASEEVEKRFVDNCGSEVETESNNSEPCTLSDLDLEKSPKFTTRRKFVQLVNSTEQLDAIDKDEEQHPAQNCSSEVDIESNDDNNSELSAKLDELTTRIPGDKLVEVIEPVGHLDECNKKEEIHPVENYSNESNTDDNSEKNSVDEDTALDKFPILEPNKRLVPSIAQINAGCKEEVESGYTEVDKLNHTPPPQIVSLIPKKRGSDSSMSSTSIYSSIGSKRGLKIASSLFSLTIDDDSDIERDQTVLSSRSASSIPNLLNNFDIICYTDVFKNGAVNLNQERHDLSSSENELNVIHSESEPNINKLTNYEEDDVSKNSINSDFSGTEWVVGAHVDLDSISQSKESPRESVNHTKESVSNSTPPLQIFNVQQDQIDSSFVARQNSLTTPNNTQLIVEETSVPISSIMECKSSNPCEFEDQKQNVTEDIPELENWQYQLPSPPTAFRDLTPTNLTEVTNYDTVTLEGFKQESIITNPMLYEKLELIKDFETDTLSDLTSNISEDEKPMLNKLTLENLEKRKSLVYNRELSTSLKVAENETATKRSDVINEIEEVINGTKIWSRQNSATTTDLTPTLEKQIPNFKISTYDKPRTKINIFEDVTVRNNVEISSFPPEVTDDSVEAQHNILQKNKSSDSISSEDSFKKPQEYSKYKVFSKNIFAKNTFNTVNRSESFGPNNSKPQNPVQRSRSQVALNNYKSEKTVENETGTLSKSNSLFDVSGLHSLEVMRKIQTTLNTPNSSMEHLLEDKQLVENEEKNVEDKESTNSKEDSVTKTYKYQGPPAINLSTWSERPKTKVSLKEDTDYRSNEINSNNRNDNKVSFKVNGTESVERQESGNVIIKISENNYRKPFSSINKIEVGVRPHSIAIPNDSDISRVPIVRAVELKKPFKDNIQKSVTQINASNDVEITNNVRNKLKDWQTNGDYTKSLDGLGQLQGSNEEAKTDRFKRIVQRVNSINRFAPTVVGFRSAEFGNDNTPRSRKSWNVPSSYGTLPPKMNIETTEKSNNFAPNNNVPFSRAILRRVEIKKPSNDDSKIEAPDNIVFRNNSVGNKMPNYNRYSTGYMHPKESFRQSSVESEIVSVPNPPPAPKVIIKKKPPVSIKTFEVVADPRNDLLNSIRSFGGVKGLKRVKV